MKFPRTLRIVLAFTALLIAAACGTVGGRHFNQPPSLPPTGNNYTTCNGQAVPNWLSTVYKQNYQPAVAALLSPEGSHRLPGLEEVFPGIRAQPGR